MIQYIQYNEQIRKNLIAVFHTAQFCNGAVMTGSVIYFIYYRKYFFLTNHIRGLVTEFGSNDCGNVCL